MITIPCTFAYLRYWEKIKDAESHLHLGNNFPLNCSLAPPTRTAETSETEAVISNLYPTSKYKLKLAVWEYFGYRKDERLFVLEDRHSSQKLWSQSGCKKRKHIEHVYLYFRTPSLRADTVMSHL